MSLRGDLRTMALPDVLQWIATGHKTGTLHVERRSVQKRIIVRDGNIFSSWSNDPRESLGQFLIRLRLVTEGQPFRAVLDPEGKGGLAGGGKSRREMTLEPRRSEFETASLLFNLHGRGLVEVDRVGGARGTDPVGVTQGLLKLAYERLRERRYDAAMKAYEEVLALDRLNQNAKKGLLAAMEARRNEKAASKVPLDKVPALRVDLLSLTRENLDPQEGFVLSRVNGEWDVQSILKLCPMGEEEALLIFARLIDRNLVTLRDPK